MPSCVVLLSGGIDSSTTLAIAHAEGFELNALTIDYGQRHRVEIECARTVARRFSVRRHLVLPLDMTAIGGSALTTQDIDVPKDRFSDVDGAAANDIPATYVPARNTVFLSLALAWAETLEADNIFIGVNAVDYSGYPDCRPEFIHAFEEMANLATKISAEGRLRFTVRTPLISMSKVEIIRRGRELGLDYSMTWSCYDPTPTGKPCMRCDSCIIRENALREK
ncbi:MAG: 7-cyano-7-deazaguanine synthase QueC [Nitrospirae bacterium]|uniref:7-cyano-7-deazaguanine synthase QueC n=1 Tax=Candidatus Magnetobacterium casense TaxID=1455061 RepID=UPI00058EEA88|nr:7-cyano-7-deazaguanine synthase QueC [Candidatus Magnetobacterium casensis]MBF0337457.1 7-cyano-7-deazaguanine synthase QueC [Nitrospirota bacterium]